MATDGGDAPASRGAPGCAGLLWFFIKLPFMIIVMVPRLGQVLRNEAATDTGMRARSGREELTPADDQAVVAAGLVEMKSRDAGFDVAAPVRRVVRASEVVDQARRTGGRFGSP